MVPESPGCSGRQTPLPCERHRETFPPHDIELRSLPFAHRLCDRRISLRIDGREIRLEGIDAPEHNQTCQNEAGQSFACGAVARHALKALVGRGELTCQPDGTDLYSRTLAHCSAGGVEINQAMVELGMARAFEKYSGEYLADEAEAKAARRGFWAGTWAAPWDFRHSEKAAP